MALCGEKLFQNRPRTDIYFSVSYDKKQQDYLFIDMFLFDRSGERWFMGILL